MPELPQIQPQAGVTPAGVVQVPASETAGQVASMAKESIDQAYELGRQAQIMNRYISFHTGDGAFISGASQVMHDTQGIADPQKQAAARMQGLNQLHDNIIKQYGPSAGPELPAQLAVRYGESQRQVYVAQQGANHDNTVNNLAAMHDQLIRAGTDADAKDLPGIVQSYNDTVDTGVKMGYIGQGFANKQKQAFKDDLQFSLVSKQVSANPLYAMQITEKNSGLTGQQISLIQYRAGSMENRTNDSAALAMKADTNRNDTIALSGGFSDAELTAKALKGEVSPEAFKRIKGYPVDDLNTAAGLADNVSRMPPMSKAQWEAYKEQTLKANPQLRQRAWSIFNDAVSSREESDANTQGLNTHAEINKYTERLRHQYPGGYGSGADNDTATAYQRDLHDMNNDFTHATPDTLDAVRKKWDKKTAPPPPKAAPGPTEEQRKAAAAAKISKMLENLK